MEFLLSGIFGILVYALISRWIFRVNEHIKNQKVIIDLLGQVLLRQGYTVDEVKTILKKYD